MSKPKIELMMDSGAFTCFTKGKTLSVEEYTTFCLSNPESIAYAVNLDHINPKNPEVAAAKGWENLCYMKDKGVDAIPVYHARERLDWFDKMLDTCKYIGISGTSLVSPTEHLAFYDLAHHYGTDSEGYPLAKYHAFGDLAPHSILTYPWGSMDAATWMIMGGRAGAVKLNGKSFNLHSKKVRDNNYIHAGLEGPAKQSWERECRFLGLDPDKVFPAFETSSGSEAAMIRSYMVASDILKLRDRASDVDRFRKPKSLISQKKQTTLKGIHRVGPPVIYFVISPSAYCFNFPVIVALGIQNILVSYFYVKSEKPAFWNSKLLPFLYDPLGFCENDPKTKKFWEKLQEVLLVPPVKETTCVSDLSDTISKTESVVDVIPSN